MMRSRWPVGFMIMLAISATGGILRDPLHDATRRGKERFDQGQYPQALEAFGRGRAEDPDHPVLAFNIGDALLAMGKTAEARAEYQKAMASSDNRLKARTRYNVGNTHAVDNNWTAAAAAFRDSLLLDPAQTDAKRNLELALRKIAEQQEQQHQQQQSGHSQTDKESQAEGAGAQSRGGKQTEKQRSEQQTDKRTAGPKNQSAGSEKNREAADTPFTEPGPKDKKTERTTTTTTAGGTDKRDAVPVMDKAQAMRLLHALEKKEKKEMLRLQQGPARKRPPTERDW